MMTRAERRMGWRMGVPFVLVCLVIGALVGMVADKVSGAEGQPAHEGPALHMVAPRMS